MRPGPASACLPGPLPPIPARFRFQSDDEFACYERRLSAGRHQAGRDEAYVSVEGIWSPTTGDSAPEWWGLPPVPRLWRCRAHGEYFLNEKRPDGRLSFQAIDMIH